MDIAIRDYGCIYVDVNEENPKARNFYRHLDFREYERTESDSQGRPFPIIKMELSVLKQSGSTLSRKIDAQYILNLYWSFLKNRPDVTSFIEE